MFNKIRNIIVTAMVSLGVLAAIPATANAHHNYHGGGAGFGIWFGESGHSHWRRDHRRPRHWDNGRRYSPRARVRGCSVRRALNKAHRMGVRHARVRIANHRVIKVKGRSHGHRVRIVFARAPGCPVIRY